MMMMKKKIGPLPPKFSVDPIDDSGVPQLALKSKRSPSLLANFFISSAFAQGVNCTNEMEFHNQHALQPYHLRDSEDELDGKKVVTAFYAQALFYDCNIRQQIAEGARVDPSVQNGKEVFVSHPIKEDESPKRETRYVSWTNGDDTPKGKLVNVYNQDDGTRTRTRIDLNTESSSKKTVSVTFFFDKESQNIDGRARAGFIETLDEDGEPAEHKIWGRYYIGGEDHFVQVRARVKPNGSYIILKRCAVAGTGDTDIVCPPDTAEEKYYYDKDGTSYSDGALAEAAGVDISTLGSDIPTMDRFFADGETEDTFFRPVFNI